MQQPVVYAWNLPLRRIDGLGRRSVRGPTGGLLGGSMGVRACGASSSSSCLCRTTVLCDIGVPCSSLDMFSGVLIRVRTRWVADRDVYRTRSIGTAGLEVASRGLNGGNSFKVSGPELGVLLGPQIKVMKSINIDPAGKHSSRCALCCHGRHKGSPRNCSRIAVLVTSSARGSGKIGLS